MLTHVSQATVYAAVDELVGILGIKEEIAHWPLVDLARRKKTAECAQQVAVELGLPVRIDLSYVSDSPSSGTGSRFQSSDLVETGRPAESSGSIVAQVSVPDGLPLYGSADLMGYPISVRLGKHCHKTPKTLVAVLAHEMSHVLLYALRHPKASSDLHVDLVPLILGVCRRTGLS